RPSFARWSHRHSAKSLCTAVTAAEDGCWAGHPCSPSDQRVFSEPLVRVSAISRASLHRRSPSRDASTDNHPTPARRSRTMTKHALRSAAAAASVLPLLWLNGPARADVVTFPTQHVRLGFQATFPFSDTKSGQVPCVSYSASFNGTGSLVVDLGADITVSYDRADIVPGGNVPIHVTYTPTNDAGPEVTVNAAADVDFSTDLDDACIGGVVAGCVLLPLPICPLLIAIAVELDTFHDEFNNFNVISAMGDFKAPLGADPPIVVPGTGDSATLQFLGS